MLSKKVKSGPSNQAIAYPGFRSMKQFGVFLLFPGWNASAPHDNPLALNKPVHIYIYNWV